MKRYLSILLAVLLVLSMSVCALAAPLDSYYVDDDAVTLTLRGTIDGAKKGDQIRIELLEKDVTLDADAEYTGDKVLSDFILFTQVPADAKGGYEITVSMLDSEGEERETGFYTLRVNGKETEKRVYFAPSYEKDDFLDEVDALCYEEEDVAVEGLVEIFDMENPDSKAINMFNITDEYVLSVEPETLASSFYAMVCDGAAIGTSSSFSETLCTAAHIAALDEGAAIDIVKYADEFGLKEEYVNIYNSQVDETTKTNFANNYYKDKGYRTPKEVEAAFAEAVQLAFYNSFDSAYDVETFIETFGEDLGVDMDDYKDLKTTSKTKLYQAVLKFGSVSSVDNLVTKINSKIDDVLDDQKDSSGGGSGGGGGGGSFTGTSGNGFSGTTTSNPIVAGGKDTSAKFSDMAGNEWAIEAVNALADKGIVNGVGGGMFAPGREVTREEMLAMLLRAYNVDVTGALADKFADVDASAWYAPYVAKAVAEGWVKGMSDTEFGTGRYITREEAATMAFRISVSFGKQYTSAASKFSDDTEIFDYAKEPVYSLAGVGVINGMGDGTFAPKANCTRAQAAKIIYTLIN